MTEPLNRWEKIEWAFQHLVRHSDYDRATIETGMSDAELLNIYAMEHGYPVDEPKDTDTSPWLWDALEALQKKPGDG